ncbi:hypothetical protein PIB30_065052 [Stylosanthes scabra]|uniref:Transposase MuDR plant domain-containing protein n=1 Tax=Stylosanthes scabra TaxID=79078 RepID=A0ABU6UMX9_9FABA|nr:hypothetical protein [Stylosanthes scabra]
MLEELYSGSEDDFKANYEALEKEEEEGDEGIDMAVQKYSNPLASHHPFGIPSCVRELDLEALDAHEFPEFANIAIATRDDGELMIGMEYTCRKAVVSATRKYTISRGVDYTVWESEPRTFCAKCKLYGNGCDWLIRASLIQKRDFGPFVESDPSLKVKSVIAQIQSKYNYTISYHKAWLGK